MNIHYNCNSLLAYADKYKRMDTVSNQKNNPSHFNLSETFINCINNIKLLSLKKGQRIHFNPSANATIYTDPEKIKLVCYNIISNAVMHGENSCDIFIEFHVSSSLVFSFKVHNTKGAIPTHRLQKNAFESISFPEFKNGLGLFIIQSTCNDLGLNCLINSTIENGTIITISTKDH